MTHYSPPVIKQVPPAEIWPGIKRVVKATPLALAIALGWALGTVWAALQWTGSAVGYVFGVVFMAAHTLAFAVYYGFLKGARIKLVKAAEVKRRPSIPQ